MRPVTLNTKMAVAVSLLVAGMVSVMGVIAITYFHEVFEATASRQQYDMISTVAKDIDSDFSDAQKALVAVAGMLPADVIADPAKAQRFLEARAGTRTIFDHGLILLNNEGVLVAETPYTPGRRGADLSSRDYFRKTVASGRPVIADPIVASRPGHSLVVTFTAPVFDGTGKMIAVLGGGLNLMKDNALGKAARIRIGKTGYVYIFDTDRTMIVHPDRERMLKRDIPPGVNKLLDQAIEGFEGSGETVNSKGIPMLVSFKRMASTNWIVAGNYPVAEVHEPIYKAQWYIFIALVLVCASSVLLVWLLTKRLTAPLLLFTRHVAELLDKQGEERFFSNGTHDEIGTLAQTFNRMMKELDARQTELRKSKELYQIVADFSSDMAIWRGPDGEMHYISPQSRHLTGYGEEEFYRDPQLIDRLIHPDDQDGWREHQRDVGVDLQPTPLEFRIVTKTGEVRRVSHLCRQVYSDSGVLLGVRGSFSDITERKLAEESLSRSEGKYRLLIGNIPDVIWTGDSDGRNVFISANVEKIYGYTPEEIYRDSPGIWFDRVHPDDLDRVKEAYELLFTENRRLDVECRIRRRDGEWIWLHSKAAGTYERDGVQYADGIFADITAHKRAQEEIRKLSLAVEHSPASIVITDPTGTIEYVNPKFSQVTGYAREEAIGQNPRILKSGQTAPSVYREMWQTITSGREWQGECCNRRKSGELFWENTRISPITDEAGAITHFMAVKEDITTRKHTERELQKSREELNVKHEKLKDLFKQVELIKKEWERTMDCIGDMIILVDPEGNIVRCNKAFQEFVGKTYLHLVGSDCKELLHEHGLEVSDFASRRELSHEPTGRWYVLEAYPFKAVTSFEISGAVITIHDTTELKQAADELAKAYAELKATQSQMLQNEKMASIGQLAAGVAHEINNPIGFVSSNLGTLDKYVRKMVDFIGVQTEKLGSLDAPELSQEIEAKRKSLKLDYIVEDTGNLIRESLEGTDRIRKIVQDLKTFSRVDEAEHKLADINECLDSTINIVWNEIKYKAVLKKDYGELPQTKCYPQQLAQVFMNLLVNAAHAIENQGEITVRSWNENDASYVSVTDTGCGIPQEIQSRIFEPFFTTKEVGKGTGLGLSISYDIIKKHKGDIIVASELGKGSTFTVRIPVVDGR